MGSLAKAIRPCKVAPCKAAAPVELVASAELVAASTELVAASAEVDATGRVGAIVEVVDGTLVIKDVK